MNTSNRANFLNLKVSILSLVLCLVLVGGEASSTDVVAREIANNFQQLTDLEQKAYKEWYCAKEDRQLERIIELGQNYLSDYPNGKYGGYISIIIGFARSALDPTQRNRAERFRAEVRGSLTDSKAELDDLLTNVLANKSNVNTKARNGVTALMFAAASGNVEAEKTLIKREADLDAIESANGWTALVYAIWLGDPFSVQQLLEAYPNANIKDKEGRTAQDHAIATGNFELMLLISSRPMAGSSADYGPGSKPCERN